jgi:hypothetical protein
VLIAIRHGDGRLVDLDVRQRMGRLRAGHRLADGDALDAGDGQNVSRAAHRFVDALQSFERIQLGDAVLWNVPSSFAMATSSPRFSVPLNTRPIAKRPR